MLTNESFPVDDQSIDRPSQQDQPKVVGMPDLVALRSLGRLTGPRPAGFMQMLEPQAIWTRLDDGVRTEAARGVVESVARVFDRRLNRQGAFPSLQLGEELAQATGTIIEKIQHEAPDLKINKVYAEGVARLVRDMDPGRAVHYLDEDFVGELQDRVPEDSSLWHEIGDFFSVGELLRRAQSVGDPDKETVKSVQKAWQIAQDRQGYMATLMGETPLHPEFASSLTDTSLLYLTTRFPASSDEKLQTAATLFEEAAAACPLMAEYGPEQITSLLIRQKMDSNKDTVLQKLAEQEKLVHYMVRNGLDPRYAMNIARNSGGNMAVVDKLLAGRRADSVLYRDFGTSGEKDARKRQALERGLVTREHGVLVSHGPEYRDVLLDIDESDKLTDTEKTTIYNLMTDITHRNSEYEYRIEPVVGVEFSDIERKQFSLALTKALYGIRYWIDHGEAPARVPMGSKEPEVAMSKNDMLVALGYLNEFTRLQSMVEVHTDRLGGDEDETSAPEANVELGYLEKTDSHMLLLTKMHRAPESDGGYERGKSPRINRICGLHGAQPSLDAHLRELNSLSMRNDLDSDGILRLDIGGKTDDPNTPDYMVAKLLSLGGWYRDQLHGAGASDYHVDIGTVTPEAFARIVQRYRRAVSYVQSPLHVPLEQPSGARLDLAGDQIPQPHQFAQAQRPAA